MALMGVFGGSVNTCASHVSSAKVETKSGGDKRLRQRERSHIPEIPPHPSAFFAGSSGPNMQQFFGGTRHKHKSMDLHRNEVATASEDDIHDEATLF